MRGGDTGSFGWIVCVTPAPERRAGSVHMDLVYLLSMCPSSTLPLETLVPCTGKSTGARWNRDTKFSSSPWRRLGNLLVQTGGELVITYLII